jgi:predicted nucleic acid-binding protein
VVAYLDSSALVKLVVAEPESASLRRYLRTHPQRVSSALSRVEVLRAVRRHGSDALRLAREVLGRIDLILLDDALLDAASELEGHSLRSLDAIHLASAQAVGVDLAAVVTYDRRMIEAARQMALTVHSPGMR